MILTLLAAASVLFPGKTPAEVSGRLAAHCVDTHGVVDEASVGEVRCVWYSTIVAKYVIFPVEGGTTVQLTRYIDGARVEDEASDQEGLNYLASVR